MSKRWFVTVTEIHKVDYQVTAKTSDEAKRLVDEVRADGVENPGVEQIYEQITYETPQHEWESRPDTWGRPEDDRS